MIPKLIFRSYLGFLFLFGVAVRLDFNNDNCYLQPGYEQGLYTVIVMITIMFGIMGIVCYREEKENEILTKEGRRSSFYYRQKVFEGFKTDKKIRWDVLW